MSLSHIDPSGTADADHALYRRSLWVVAASQVFGGAGLAAGITVGALLAQDMLGGEGAAGIPAALFTLGSAVAAYAVGWLSQRSGRRVGLTAGFLIGSLGAVGVVAAAILDAPVLLFAALFIYGSGTATNMQARYAGTDLAPFHSRGTAVSIAMVSTTLGAVAGPSSIGITGTLAEGMNVPALAGPFLLAALAYGTAGLILLVFLRPDPLLVARDIGRHTLRTGTNTSAGDHSMTGASTRANGLLFGAIVMVLAQVAMTAIMTMTPVHMRNHSHSLNDIGLVIGVHIGAMFLPSLVTGRLVDLVGRVPMAVASALTLLAAGIVSAQAPGDSMHLLALGLCLLGLGWNFGLISGTALIIDATSLATRARVQGAVDVAIAIAGAGGGAASGVLVDAYSYGILAVAGGLLSLLIVPFAVWHAFSKHSTEIDTAVPF